VSISTSTRKRAVCRGPASRSLVQEADLAPGQHFIGGAFRPNLSGRSLDVVDPCSGRTIAQVAAGTAEDTDTAVAAAVAAGPHGDG
jgi:aminobutyraldehyde dehydrogenase